MATVQQSIDIRVPVHTAYNPLTQFEDYPQFMEEVEAVQQIDDTHLHWTSRIAHHLHARYGQGPRCLSAYVAQLVEKMSSPSEPDLPAAVSGISSATGADTGTATGFAGAGARP